MLRNFPSLNVVIPIAGNATRMFPASLVAPKSLFPIYNPETGQVEPILLVLLRQTVEACRIREIEINKICIVASEWQVDHLNSLFYDTKRLNLYRNKYPEIVKDIEEIATRLKIVLQKEQRGYGHAVLQAKEEFTNTQNLPILVMLGDHIYISHKRHESCILQVIDAFITLHHSRKSTYNGENPPHNIQHGSHLMDFFVTSIDRCNEIDLKTNGIVTGTPCHIDKQTFIQITHTEEKPSVDSARRNLYIQSEEIQQKFNLQQEQYLCYFGIEILPYRIFEHLEKLFLPESDEELNLRIGQGSLLKEINLYGIFIDGERLDTGLPEEYVASLNKFLKHTSSNQ